MDVKFSLNLEGITRPYPVGSVSILLKQRCRKLYRDAHGHEHLLQDFIVSEGRLPLIQIPVYSPVHIFSALMAVPLDHRLRIFLYEHLGRMSVELSAGGVGGFSLFADVQVVLIKVVREDERIERFLRKEASRLLIQRLETLRFDLNEVKAREDRCAVCLEKLLQEEEEEEEEEEDEETKLIMLPCSHIYHASCISRWFEQQTSCPLCRRAIQVEVLVP